MRKQVDNAAVEVGGQSIEHVAQIGPEFEPVEPGRLHQAHSHGHTLAGEFAATEQPILPAHGPGLDLAFEVVVVYGHRPVEQVARQRWPVVEAVVDGVGGEAAIGDTTAFELQLGVQLLPPRCGNALAGRRAGLVVHAGERLLGTVDRREAHDRLGGEGALARLGEFVELAPGMHGTGRRDSLREGTGSEFGI